MKKYLVFALSVCLLSACNSGENDLIPEETDPVEITLSAKSLSIDVETKAPYTAETPGAKDSETKLVARVVSTNKVDKDNNNTPDYTASTLYSNGQMTFTSTDGTADAVKYDSAVDNVTYYPADGSTIYLSGFYPYSTWTIGKTTASFTFTGKEDVMYAWQKSNNKEGAQGTTPVVPNLEFNHLLTLLNVSVKAATSEAITAWGKITKIELIAAAGVDSLNTVTVTMATKPTEGENPMPTVVSPSNASTTVPIPFYLTGSDDKVSSDSDKSITLTTSSVSSAYAMVAPITIETGATDPAYYTLKVYSENYTDGREVTIKLKNGNSQFEGSTQGKSFTITLTFNATDIIATASIVAWDPSGSADEDIK
ncbi:fimbrillin family protein [Parabacteroides sp. OttesenSCG-928-K15]|nr:fimbrillin family protein [Parabacteroides sp. OttesenSCG-928-K15]